MQLSSNPIISSPVEPDARLQDLLAELQQLPDTLFPPAQMMQVIGSPDKDHYLQVIKQLFGDLYHIGGLNPDSRVLDLGCGCGRMALPFLSLIDTGSYQGIDVWPEGIAWCQQQLSKRNPRFHFELLQADNNYYFAAQNQRPNRFQLAQIQDQEIDFAFAISVFTHLNPQDSQSYLDEFYRLLHPGACAYVTAFIIDAEFFRFVADTGQHQAVREQQDGFYSAYEKQHYLCGYSQQRWQQMLDQAGLRIVSFDPGSWAHKAGARRYQDTFVIARA